MHTLTDATHDPALQSWVASANRPGCDFPLQNLPLGRFRPPGRTPEIAEPLRVGVAIGDQVLDLKLAATLCPWSEEVHPLLLPLAAGDLAAFMALGRPAWRVLRAGLSAALAADSDQGPFLESCLLPLADAQMALPCRIGDYTDFFVGIHHARRIGQLMRPDNPLLPNYSWVPIGYHGRASSVGIEGRVRRPHGQTRSATERPLVGPSQRLDYDLKLGLERYFADRPDVFVVGDLLWYAVEGQPLPDSPSRPGTRLVGGHLCAPHPAVAAPVEYRWRAAAAQRRAHCRIETGEGSRPRRSRAPAGQDASARVGTERGELSRCRAYAVAKANSGTSARVAPVGCSVAGNSARWSGVKKK